MRSLITLAIVCCCGAAAAIISTRASQAVDGKVGGAGQARAAGVAPASFLLAVYDATGTQRGQITAKPNQIVFGGEQSLRIDAQDWAEILAAFAAVPDRLWHASTKLSAFQRFEQTKPQGGDYYYVKSTGGSDFHARGDGWRSSGLDHIKEAVWQVIRRRARPALETDQKILKDRPKGEYFVEPFESLRTALRIKF